MKFAIHNQTTKYYILATSLPILLLFIITFLLVTLLQKDINLNKKEILGTHQLYSLFKLSGYIQKVRGLEHIYFRNGSNDNQSEALLNSIRNDTNSNFNRLLDIKFSQLNAQLIKKITALKKQFNDLSKKKAKNNFKEYSLIVSEVIDLMRDVAIQSNIMLDNHLETYYLGVILTESLPNFAEIIGKARGLVSAIPAGKIVSDVDIERINNNAYEIITAIKRIEQIKKTALENTIGIESEIYSYITNFKYSAISFKNLISKRIDNNFPTLTSQSIFDKGTEVISLAETLHAKVGEHLRNKLNQRTANYTKQLKIAVAAAIISTILIISFAMFVYRNNRENLSKIISSRTMLKTILDTIPIGVYWKDLNGKYLGANKIYLKNLGVENFNSISGLDNKELNLLQGEVPSSQYDKEIINTAKPKLHSKVVMAWSQGPELIDISRVPLLESNGSIFGILGVYEDITVIQRQQNELIESESHFRYLVESASAVPWEFDTSLMLFTYVGPQAVELLGYPVENWYQSNFLSSHLHPDDKNKIMEYYNEQTNIDSDIEYRIRTFSGEYKWIRDNLRKQSNSNKQNIIRGFMFDVTERKNADITLRLLATTFELQQPVIITDKDTNILRVNKAFTKTTGYEEQDVIGKTPRMFKSGHHNNDFYNELWSSLNTSGHWQGDIWNRRKNGEIYPLWQSITAVTDDKGNISHYVASFFEQTERYETQAREKLILESTSEAIYGVNNDGICTFVNPACLNLLGYENQNELIGKNIYALIHGSEDIHSNENTELKGDSFHYYSETLCRKDGSEFHAECSSNTIMRAGSVLGRVITFYDVTKQLLENQQLRSDKSESDKANLAKSEFIARMNHELRTPLNAILGFTQLIDIDPSVSETCKEFSLEIHRAGHHLLSLINDILDLAKIEAGQMNIKLETVYLKDIIDECAGLIIPLAQQNNIALKFNTSNIEDKLIEVDPTRLNEVLLNLLSNAVKYNSSEGIILLETSIKENNHIRISVTDTGAGLSQTDQQSLFKPFERLGAERSQIEGTGIGLVISKHIIEIMGGYIGVDSSVGKGSTFWIELNYSNSIDENNDESIFPTKSNIIDFTSIKDKTYDVLYVEDNLSNIRLIEHVLAEFSFINLKIALSAEIALDMIKEKEPDLMIFDINLPGINGHELLKKTRTIKKYKSTPVFAMSANAMTKDIELALSQGFSQYITKPIDVSLFLGHLFDSLGIKNKI